MKAVDTVDVDKTLADGGAMGGNVDTLSTAGTGRAVTHLEGGHLAGARYTHGDDNERADPRGEGDVKMGRQAPNRTGSTTRAKAGFAIGA